MSRIDEFKEHLGSTEKDILEYYEPEIQKLFDLLENENLLNLSFTNEQISRLKKFIRTSNAAIQLYENFNRIFTLNRKETDEKIAKLQNLGFKVETLADQYGSTLCHSYQVMAERLKLHLVTLINFDLLGLQNAHKSTLGKIVVTLKTKYPENKFVSYLDTNIRNAVTHYSYFFQGDTLTFCQGYFDPKPSKMTIADFMKEAIILNRLTEAFFIIFSDRYTGPGKLHLDDC